MSSSRQRVAHDSGYPATFWVTGARYALGHHPYKADCDRDRRDGKWLQHHTRDVVRSYRGYSVEVKTGMLEASRNRIYRYRALIYRYRALHNAPTYSGLPTSSIPHDNGSVAGNPFCSQRKVKSHKSPEKNQFSPANPCTLPQLRHCG